MFNELLLPALPPTFLRWENEYFQELCAFLDIDHPKKLLKVSRDMAKSTALLAFSIREFLRDPMIAQGWGHGVQELGIKKGKAIRWHFENNKYLKMIAPDICWPEPSRQAEKWTEKEWIIRRPSGRPDIPSMMCFGMDNIPTSVHLDLAILDDLEIRENSTSPEQRQKLKEAFLDFLPILPAKARRIVSGTPWSFSGLIETLSADPEYFKFVRPCYVNGQPLWPDRWPKKALDKRISEVGPKVAAAQYHLKPLPSTSMTFLESYFADRRLPDPQKVTTLRFLYLDPTGYSISTGGNNLCEAGFVSVLWGSDKKRYIEDAYGAILSPWDTLQRVFNENERLFDFGGAMPGTQEHEAALRKEENHEKARITGGLVVEVNMPTVTADIVNREQKRRYGRLLFTVHEIKHAGAESKKGDYGRIARLQPRYINGEIIHGPALAGGPLENQLLQFPEGDLVDIADAAAMTEEVGWYPALKQNLIYRPETEIVDPKAYIRKKIQEQKKANRSNEI